MLGPLTSFSGSTVYWPHFCPWQLRPTFIQSHVVISESHNIRRPTSRVRSAKRTLRWIGRSRSFKVILIGVSRNPERRIVVVISGTIGALQTLRVHSPGGSTLLAALYVMASTLKVWRQIENRTPSIDANLREEHSCQILSRSHLKSTEP